MVALLEAEPTGPLVWMTTSAEVPAVEGNLAARRFWARCEGELPEAKLLWNRLPKATPRTVIAINVPTQAASTTRRRAWQKEAHLPSQDLSVLIGAEVLRAARVRFTIDELYQVFIADELSPVF